MALYPLGTATSDVLPERHSVDAKVVSPCRGSWKFRSRTGGESVCPYPDGMDGDGPDSTLPPMVLHQAHARLVRSRCMVSRP